MPPILVVALVHPRRVGFRAYFTLKAIRVRREDAAQIRNSASKSHAAKGVSHASLVCNAPVGTVLVRAARIRAGPHCLTGFADRSVP